VPDAGPAPTEARMVVAADDRALLLEPRERSQEDVLGAVGVLVLVDEDVLVAVLPLLERAVACFENAAGEEQEVVEVDRVVVAEELVVPLPHDGGDPVELALRARCEVGGAPALVLVAREHRAGTAKARMRYATRCVRTRVFPDPAPARISRGPSPWVTAARCSGFSGSRIGSDITSIV